MKKYSLGLDVGTNSIGWAVVDEENNLVRKNGFTLWGVRMFEDSKAAAERRRYRTGRRRLKKRKYRINILRSLFNDEINKVDPTFFERMDDSFYKIEDKKYNNYNNLFIDKYTDKDFFNEFPTIYHLRDYLINSNKKEDIRFIYLALHNMIKYRGNFLYPGESLDSVDDSSVNRVLKEFNLVCVELMNEFEDYDDYFTQIAVDKELLNNIKDILIGISTKKDKKDNLKKLLNVDNKTLVNELLIPLLVGLKCNISSLTIIKHLKHEKCDITLDCENIEELIDKNRSVNPELHKLLDFIPMLKEVTDYYFIVKLLGDGNTMISKAMISKYDEHQEDLIRLKKFIKKYSKDKYYECFRAYNKDLNNYAKYIGMTNVSNTMKRFGHCTRDKFYEYLLKIFKSIDSPAAKYDIDYFTSKIENNDFLLRQNSDQNGSLPMQFNLIEMRIILNNQAKYYSFLNDVDEKGISVKDKIEKTFKYVVPYYVGPLNGERSWVVRTNDKIYPWNFEEVVNLDETAKKFILNMQRKCTYLKGDSDYCLPKQSIIYSKYNCLTYLNKLSIAGSLITYDVKMDLYKNVFLKNKKPTKKDIINHIKTKYGIKDVLTSGLKEIPEVNCDMSSYIKMKEIFHDVESNLEMIENIIKDIVVFSDKRILEKRLVNLYNLNIETVKKLKDLNYSGYCNLSSKLINGLQICNLSTGEVCGNVLSIMEKTNMNLQELLYHHDYRLIDIINEYNKEQISDVNDMTLEDFLDENALVSPIMKRALIQSVAIIDEVERILNQPIDKYYIECTRREEKKKPTNSRYNYLKDLYKNCQDVCKEYNIDLKALNQKLDENKDALKSDLLYLYFTQLGRCMYSLEKIDFDTLMKHNNLYDVDHIYPQSLVKDDSFSNKALVLKKINNRKQDNLLFEVDGLLNKDCFGFFNKLRELKLISKEKYLRLTKKELSSAEIETFINRQIVATSQSVKGLIEVLKLYKGVNPTNIIFSKAQNIHVARELFDWPKSRLANNFHHAHDAYLNVVIGRVVHNYFATNYFNTSNDYYRMKTEKKTTNIKTLLQYDRYINGKLLWDKNKMVALINHNLYERYDVSETIRSYNPNDLLSKVTISPAKAGTVPQKNDGPLSNIDKYGGYKSYSYSKYIIVKIVDKKGKAECVLEAIPKAYENRENEYLEKNGYTNFEIVHNNIKTNVVVMYKDLKYTITCKTKNQFGLKNFQDRFFNKNNIKLIKKIEKYVDNKSNKRNMPINGDEIEIAAAREGLDALVITKADMICLYEEIKKKYSNKKYSFSVIKGIVDNMNIDYDQFNVEDLVIINNELLGLLQTNSRKTADLSLIGLSKNSGSLCGSKKLKIGTKFIFESVTGYYSKVLFEVLE